MCRILPAAARPVHPREPHPGRGPSGSLFVRHVVQLIEVDAVDAQALQANVQMGQESSSIRAGDLLARITSWRLPEMAMPIRSSLVV